MKKVISVLSVFVLFLASCGEFTAVTADAENSSRNLSAPVQVIAIEDIERAHYGISERSRVVTVEVQNLAFDKELYIFGELVDGTWEELNSSYSAGNYISTTSTGSEIWEIQANWTEYYGDTEWADELVVKYVAGTETYWDNNGGANYVSLGHSGTNLLGTNVKVYTGYYRSYDNKLEVNVDVKNLAYNKEVKVVYTTDNWNTIMEGYASFVPTVWMSYARPIYSPNANGVERWSATLDLPAGTNKENIQYAVQYTVDGQVFWDNNYGNDYIVY